MIEEKFANYWNQKHPDNPAIDQFKPQDIAYEKSGSSLTKTQWLKEEGLGNYKADFALINYPVLVEFDGQGKSSHRGAGSTRDKVKDNQNLLLGYLTLRFPVSTVKANMAYVEDIILETLEIWFEEKED